MEKDPTKQVKHEANTAAIIRLVKELESGGRIIVSKSSNSKTSDLILDASRILRQKGFIVCHSNFKGAKNSDEFLERLHAACYAGFFPRKSELEKYKSSQLKKMMHAYEKLKNPSPFFVKPNKSSFDFSESDWSASINLAEQFAKRFKTKTVFFFEKFDVLSRFKDSMKLQGCLRADIQNHIHVSYCFSVASIKNEVEIFHSYNAPFYLTASRVVT